MKRRKVKAVPLSEAKKALEKVRQKSIEEGIAKGREETTRLLQMIVQLNGHAAPIVKAMDTSAGSAGNLIAPPSQGDTYTGLTQSVCPLCGGRAFNGDPVTGHRFRGSGKCIDCGQIFSLVGQKRQVKALDAEKPTAAVDLDATLLTYDQWRGDDHFGQPRPGAQEFLDNLSKTHNIQIFTTRTKTDDANLDRNDLTKHDIAEKIRKHLDAHGLKYDDIYTGQGKPPADLFIDDKAVAMKPNPDRKDFQKVLKEVHKRTPDRQSFRNASASSYGSNESDNAAKPATLPLKSGPNGEPVQWFLTAGISCDPEALQYRPYDGADGLDPNRRRDESATFDPMKAPPLALWEDEDGQIQVVDGHKRLGSAKRSGCPNIRGYFIQARSAEEAKEKGRLLNVRDKLPGGRGDNRPDSDFKRSELRAGTRHEMEHTNDPSISREIAKDHLSEDPNYYTHLKQRGIKSFHDYIHQWESGRIPKNDRTTREMYADALQERGEETGNRNDLQHAAIHRVIADPLDRSRREQLAEAFGGRHAGARELKEAAEEWDGQAAEVGRFAENATWAATNGEGYHNYRDETAHRRLLGYSRRIAHSAALRGDYGSAHAHHLTMASLHADRARFHRNEATAYLRQEGPTNHEAVATHDDAADQHESAAEHHRYAAALHAALTPHYEFEGPNPRFGKGEKEDLEEVMRRYTESMEVKHAPTTPSAGPKSQDEAFGHMLEHGFGWIHPEGTVTPVSGHYQHSETLVKSHPDFAEYRGRQIGYVAGEVYHKALAAGHIHVTRSNNTTYATGTPSALQQHRRYLKDISFRGDLELVHHDPSEYTEDGRYKSREEREVKAFHKDYEDYLHDAGRSGEVEAEAHKDAIRISESGWSGELGKYHSPKQRSEEAHVVTQRLLDRDEGTEIPHHIHEGAHEKAYDAAELDKPQEAAYWHRRTRDMHTLMSQTTRNPDLKEHHLEAAEIHEQAAMAHFGKSHVMPATEDRAVQMSSIITAAHGDVKKAARLASEHAHELTHKPGVYELLSPEAKENYENINPENHSNASLEHGEMHRHLKDIEVPLRPLTAEEAADPRGPQRVYGNGGGKSGWLRLGATKTWKTRPGHFQVGFRTGGQMGTHTYITHSNYHQFQTADRERQNQVYEAANAHFIANALHHEAEQSPSPHVPEEEPVHAKAFDRSIPPRKITLPAGSFITPSQGDGWKIRTPHGYIDYRHRPESNTNEIWWVESHKKGHGSELVDLMQKAHPAETVAWGVTTESGKVLRDKWHSKHPNITMSTHPHEGQFDPSGNNYGEDDYDDYDDLEDEEHGVKAVTWTDLDELRHASHATANRILSRGVTFPQNEYFQVRDRVVKAYDQLQKEHGAAYARLALGASVLSTPTDRTEIPNSAIAEMYRQVSATPEAAHDSGSLEKVRTLGRWLIRTVLEPILGVKSLDSKTLALVEAGEWVPERVVRGLTTEVKKIGELLEGGAVSDSGITGSSEQRRRKADQAAEASRVVREHNQQFNNASTHLFVDHSHDESAKKFENAPTQTFREGELPKEPPYLAETPKEQQTETKPLSLSHEQILEHLKTARVVGAEVHHSGQGGANTRHTLHFAPHHQTGEKMSGVFKGVEGEDPTLRKNVQGGTYYRREAAAYHVAKHLGMEHLVPPTTIREEFGQLGSVQQHIPHARNAHAVQAKDWYGNNPEDLRKAATFDYIIGNSDRHMGNWMIGRGSHNMNKLHLIDHGLAFPVDKDKGAGGAQELLEEAVNRGYRTFKTGGSHTHTMPMEIHNSEETWNKIHQTLIEHQIEPEAIEGTKRRFHLAASGKFSLRDLRDQSLPDLEANLPTDKINRGVKALSDRDTSDAVQLRKQVEADPENHHLREVFADSLEDAGFPHEARLHRGLAASGRALAYEEHSGRLDIGLTGTMHFLRHTGDYTSLREAHKNASEVYSRARNPNDSDEYLMQAHSEAADLLRGHHRPGEKYRHRETGREVLVSQPLHSDTGSEYEHDPRVGTNLTGSSWGVTKLTEKYHHPDEFDREYEKVEPEEKHEG